MTTLCIILFSHVLQDAQSTFSDSCNSYASRVSTLIVSSIRVHKVPFLSFLTLSLRSRSSFVLSHNSLLGLMTMARQRGSLDQWSLLIARNVSAYDYSWLASERSTIYSSFSRMIVVALPRIIFSSLPLVVTLLLPSCRLIGWRQFGTEQRGKPNGKCQYPFELVATRHSTALPSFFLLMQNHPSLFSSPQKTLLFLL